MKTELVFKRIFRYFSHGMINFDLFFLRKNFALKFSQCCKKKKHGRKKTLFSSLFFLRCPSPKSISNPPQRLTRLVSFASLPIFLFSFLLLLNYISHQKRKWRGTESMGFFGAFFSKVKRAKKCVLKKIHKSMEKNGGFTLTFWRLNFLKLNFVKLEYI